MSHGRLKIQAARFGLLAALLSAGSCAGTVDVKQALQVTDVGTGWFDAGIQDGKNKLVPNFSFRLRNTSDQDLSAISLNVVFKFADNGDVHDEVFKQRVRFDNKQTELITIRSTVGFKGDPPQTRLDMLQNSFFRDVDAVILVRQPAAQWVELHRVRLERKLLTQ
ncbi:MAG: hypothetical protein H0W08_01340 [Acidobacteria bacterium]|nr:hypothetical protein [Acidobacteriota bacterium]